MSLDMSKYLGLFVQEATEHLEGFGRELVGLEQGGGSAEAVDSMFRHAHSVKGMAASMGFHPIAALAHHAEDLMHLVRGRPEILSPALVDLLLETSDKLLELVRLAAEGQALPAQPALVDRIAAAVRGLEVAVAPAAAAAPGAAARGAEGPASPAAAPAVAAPAAAPGGVPSPAAAAPPDLGTEGALLVELRIADSCPTPGVRAFLVHKKLSALGKIVAATPTLDDCKAGRIPDGRLAVTLDTQQTPEAVRKALSQVADLSGVTVGPAPQPAPPEPAAPAVPRPPEAKGPSTVRVRTELLDYFLDTVGELILATSRLRELGRSLPEKHRREVDEGVDGLHRIVKDLHDKVMTVRMTPMASVTERLPRVARDLARQLGKEVEVEVLGAEIELDRAILEELGDPLTHVVRNSIDHGLEPAAVRVAAGKPARGRLSIRARRDRDRVLLEIEDDGKGMDPAKLKAAAVARGSITAEQAEAMGAREALLLACLPGLSTAQELSDLSGRGVGMDAVKRTIEGLGGTLEIESQPGRGTKLTFRLPLTVAVINLLLVSVGDEVFGLPIAKVVGAVEAAPETLQRSVGTLLLSYAGGLLPVHRLGALLSLPEPPAAIRPHVVVEGDTGRLALQVDRLVGQEEVVLKPLPAPLDLVPGLQGVTILGTGRPVFILDVPRLVAP